MRQIEIACPRCRGPLIVRIRDLGEPQECPHCRVGFAIDSGGRCVSGRGRPPAAHPQAASTSASGGDPLEWLSRRPRWVKRSTFGALLIVLMLGIAHALRPGPPPPPEALPERTRYAAAAFLRNDRESLRTLADPATTASLDRWLETRRPAGWDAAGVAGRASVEARELFPSARDRRAATVATLLIPAAGDPPGTQDEGARGRLDLVIFWRMSDDHTWMIDGGRTLKEATSR